MNKTFENLYKIGAKNQKKFKKLADYIVDNYVTSSSGEAMPAEASEIISLVSSIDMAAGAAFKRREYTMQGVIIGVTGTIIVMHAFEKRKKKRA